LSGTDALPADAAGPARRSSTAHAALVFAGILASRIFGLVRTRIFGYFFGVSMAADAFNAAVRIPNFMQNLLGEGALSASFIPVYAGLLAKDDREEASRLAGAIFTAVALVVAVVALIGVLLAPWLVIGLAPGFTGEKRALTIALVRILFPGTALFVLSAWCLGILNSHGRFLLSYAAPVIWNVAMIATMFAFGWRTDLSRLAVITAWGSVAGSALMFAVQLPVVLRYIDRLRIVLDFAGARVRDVYGSFLPALLSRGVVQVSALVDAILASLLIDGSPSALAYAQLLSLLPVSLFGMSVSAAELPAMARVHGTGEDVAERLRQRLTSGSRQIAFLVVPSAMGFLALGDVIAAAVFQSGRFTADVADWVWLILAGSALGLLATTIGRLYSSTFYALRDTRTPLNFAIVRVVLTISLGYLFSIPVREALELDPRWGAAGLTASAGIAGWVEFALLRRALAARIGRASLPPAFLATLWGSAAAAAGAAWGVRIATEGVSPILRALLVLGVYGLVYFAATGALRVPEVGSVLRRLRRR
jgi:putative peptidoglycan lipid II flippase